MFYEILHISKYAFSCIVSYTLFRYYIVPSDTIVFDTHFVSVHHRIGARDEQQS